jgi:benzodiazapine receptor
VYRALQLIGCIGASFLAGAIGSVVTVQSIPTWYAGLAKPPFLPPNEVFGPVWTVLYLLMGVSLYLVVRASAAEKRAAYVWFGVQLVLNTLWSLTFFGLQLPWLGVAVIVALLIAIAVTIRSFYSISRLASYLLVPYLLWTCFATYLNLGVALLN